MPQQIHVPLDRITYGPPIAEEPFRFQVAVPKRPYEQYPVLSVPIPSGVRYTSDSPREAAYLAARQLISDHTAAGIDPGVWAPAKIDEFIEGVIG